LQKRTVTPPCVQRGTKVAMLLFFRWRDPSTGGDGRSLAEDIPILTRTDFAAGGNSVGPEAAERIQEACERMGNGGSPMERCAIMGCDGGCCCAGNTVGQIRFTCGELCAAHSLAKQGPARTGFGSNTGGPSNAGLRETNPAIRRRSGRRSGISPV